MTDLEPHGTRQLRVLVVDDCEDIRDVFCRSVERFGHLSRGAGDGVEAIVMVVCQTFDLMLLDLTMPRMGGVEVARWLQAHPHVAPEMRVVVITGWIEENMEQQLMELDVTSVLPKPLPLKRLRALMTKTLQDLELPQPV